jgi:hypothetical protein
MNKKSEFVFHFNNAHRPSNRRPRLFIVNTKEGKAVEFTGQKVPDFITIISASKAANYSRKGIKQYFDYQLRCDAELEVIVCAESIKGDGFFNVSSFSALLTNNAFTYVWGDQTVNFRDLFPNPANFERFVREFFPAAWDAFERHEREAQKGLVTV